MAYLPVDMKIFVMCLMLAFSLVCGQNGGKNTPSATTSTTPSTPQTSTSLTTLKSSTSSEPSSTITTTTDGTTPETTTNIENVTTSDSASNTPSTTTIPTSTNFTTTISPPTTNITTKSTSSSSTTTSTTPNPTKSSSTTSNITTDSTPVTSDTTLNTSSSAPTSNTTQESTSSLSTSPSSSSSSANPNSSSVTPPPSSSSSSPSPTSTETSTEAPPKVQISETNIKTWKGNDSSSSWFIELSGPAKQKLSGLTLTVRNGAKNVTEGTLVTLNLKGELNDNGFYLVNRESSPDLEQKLVDDLQEILLLLSKDTTVLDHLMYATDSKPTFYEGLKELYQPSGSSELIFSMKTFDTEKTVSLSRCQAGPEGFVLVPETLGTDNNCDLESIQNLQMKLTLPNPKCDPKHPPLVNKFKDPLFSQILNGVNTRRLCGFTPYMLLESTVSAQCKDKNVEVPVKFKVRAAFPDQMRAIVDGYTIFVREKKTIKLGQDSYNVLNCTESCFKTVAPHDDNGGNNKIKVTIAVVVSCIGVFLIILLFVIVYMKRKRRGILQFRMTRLDEDDDDLIGDMDDFVGNQGATFSNFK